MNVFLTLLVDSLRLLRAKALFWVTLGLSAVAALIYLSIGFTPQGISLLFGAVNFENDVIRQGTPFAEMMYLGIFSKFIVGIWLSWVAIGLALISCSPIFPDFMSEGAIGVPLSKPVSRLYLFFCKYVGSLLFVILQVAVFCVIVFVAIRWRVGTWNPSVFWAVPLVTLVFSYIYSVVVLVSVKTRSVLFGLLAGILVWFTAFLGQKSEEMLYHFAYVEDLGENPMLGDRAQLRSWHDLSVTAMATMPKTGETVNLLDRLMVVGGKTGLSESKLVFGAMGEDRKDDSVDRAVTRHSVGYIIGTSLVFEAMILGLAAWIFCRRDF